LPKIQAALSSQYGINKINEIYLHEVESSAKHIEIATAKMQNPAAKAFYETDVGKLLLFDYNNQFYIDPNGSFLQKYIDGAFNDDAKVIYSTGEEITAPIDTYTIEDHKAFIYSTKQYAENPDDCIRRLNNLDAIIENYFNHPEEYLSPEKLVATQAENKEGEAIEVAVDFAIVKVAKGKWKILDNFELPKFVIPPPQGKVVVPQNTFITYSNPLVLVVPSNNPLKGVSDFYYYFAEDKRLIHIVPSGPFVPPLGDNSNWSLLKYILIERDHMPYTNYGDWPNVGNYFIYTLYIKEVAIEKDELISWLGDFITEEPNNFYVADLQNTFSLVKYDINTHTKQLKEKEFNLLENDKNDNADEVLAESNSTPQNEKNNEDLEITTTVIENPIETLKEDYHTQSDLKPIQNEYRVENALQICQNEEIDLGRFSLQQVIFVTQPNEALSLEKIVSAENIVTHDLPVSEALPIMVESLPIIPLEQPKSEFY
jgi:hypothetical protein